MLSDVCSTTAVSRSPPILGFHILARGGFRIRPQRRCGLERAASNNKCLAISVGPGQWCGRLVAKNLDSPSYPDSVCGPWVTACGDSIPQTLT